MNLRMLRHLCLNWKVLVALAALGVGIWILAPQLILSALPLLILAACPLSMLVMMVGMNRMRQPQDAHAAHVTSPRSIEAPPNWRPTPTSSGGTVMMSSRTRSERLADLRHQLARLQTEQEALHAELKRLNAPDTSGAHNGLLSAAPSDEHEQNHAYATLS